MAEQRLVVAQRYELDDLCFSDSSRKMPMVCRQSSASCEAEKENEDQSLLGR